MPWKRAFITTDVSFSGSLSGLGNAVTSSLIVQTQNFEQIQVLAEALSIQDVIVSDVDVLANINIVGENGRFPASVLKTPDSWYTIFVLTNDDGSDVTCVMSDSAELSELPAGFTKFRKVGWFRTDLFSDIREFVKMNGEYLYKYTDPFKIAVPQGLTQYTWDTHFPPDDNVQTAILQVNLFRTGWIYGKTNRFWIHESSTSATLDPNDGWFRVSEFFQSGIHSDYRMVNANPGATMTVFKWKLNINKGASVYMSAPQGSSVLYFNGYVDPD
jgi:hypothetical protein